MVGGTSCCGSTCVGGGSFETSGGAHVSAARHIANQMAMATTNLKEFHHQWPLCLLCSLKTRKLSSHQHVELTL